MSDQPYMVPCERPENIPEDWFISRDGKQYVDDPVLTSEQVALIERAADMGAPYDEGDSWNEVVARETAAAEVEATKAALTRRRHAKDKCFTECYFRLQCLTMALDDDHQHGTWGGYYEEELREIRRERDRRATGVS